LSTPIDQLSDAINNELTIYSQHIIDGIKEEAKKSMKELVRQTKATAPVGKRKRHYKNSITSKKTAENDRSVTYTWYVKGSNYRLSHLLENGHALRNGGRTTGTHFIQNASEPILEQYLEAVREVIRNG
jgi:hypothetical protein